MRIDRGVQRSDDQHGQQDDRQHARGDERPEVLLEVEVHRVGLHRLNETGFELQLVESQLQRRAIERLENRPHTVERLHRAIEALGVQHGHDRLPPTAQLLAHVVRSDHRRGDLLILQQQLGLRAIHRRVRGLRRRSARSEQLRGRLADDRDRERLVLQPVLTR
ncbi:MAG: hypothetical protein QM817_00970 [Archangium sp.]